MNLSCARRKSISVLRLVSGSRAHLERRAEGCSFLIVLLPTASELVLEFAWWVLCLASVVVLELARVRCPASEVVLELTPAVVAPAVVALAVSRVPVAMSPAHSPSEVPVVPPVEVSSQSSSASSMLCFARIRTLSSRPEVPLSTRCSSLVPCLPRPPLTFVHLSQGCLH